MAQPGGSAPLGDEFTQAVIDAMGPKTDPRLRVIMSSFIKHIHDFARDVQLTTDEWMMGVEMINKAGQMSNERRNEGQLLCDVIGIESLVDDITYRQATKAAAGGATASAILGPFFRHDRPTRENGTTISFNTPADAQVAFMHGKVTCAKTGKPVVAATVDVWEASTNGLYEQQDDQQVDCNLRGKFITDSEGNYSLYCIRPTPYPVPEDGPGGQLLGLMDRHLYRPGHIHVICQAEGFEPITTQIFDEKSDYLDNDSVFAVKKDLCVKFEPREGDPEAKLDLSYNISLAPKA